MKLLFDENVSPKLVRLLAKEYPGSTHVRDLGLRGAPDSQIWDHACENGFVIVSKDDDFRQRSLLYGAPPKLIWLQVGNAGASPIADLLRAAYIAASPFRARGRVRRPDPLHGSPRGLTDWPLSCEPQRLRGSIEATMFDAIAREKTAWQP